ncbi:MAG: hypothetical protein V1876_01910 [Candidatus Peregrinibacteria bacterium]
MKKRTSVHLGKVTTAPLYFHLVGVTDGHRVRIARARDWSVFHFPHWKSPVLMVWNTPGHERLFMTHIDGGFPTHEEVFKWIAQWMDVEWKTHRHKYGGAVMPLVTHEKFVTVPEALDVEEEEGAPLIVEPPCLLWHEWQPHDGHATAIAATILIR